MRPKKQRAVRFRPEVTYFKPQGVPLRDLGEVYLGLEELEAMRLVDIEKKGQCQAAEFMKVHQSTFQRTLSRAREKVTSALAQGYAVRIEGGDYNWEDEPKNITSSRSCWCKNCGYKTPHQRGKPCSTMKCPNCGSPLARG